MIEKPTYEEMEERVKELESEAEKRKQAEEALEFERSLLLSTLDSIEGGVYVSDIDSHEILYVSQSTKDTFQKEVIGGICYRELQGLDSPCEFCTNEIILKQKPEPHRWEYHNPLLNRDYVFVDRIIKWPDGRDVRFEIALDITARKQAEEALRKREARFRLLTENVTDVIWTTDLNFRLTYISPSVLQLTGYTVEEAMAQSMDEIMVPESRVKAETLLKRKLQLIEAGDDEGWAPTGLEIEQYCKDGTTIITRLNTKLLKEPDGRPGQIVGVTHDITERKQAEEALKESEKRYRKLLEVSPDAIAIIQGSPPRHLLVNPAYTKLFGYTLNDIENGFSAFKTIQEADRAEIERKMHDRHTGREIAPRYDQVDLVTKEGRIFPCEIIATLINYGGQTADMLVFTDISERIRAEEEKSNLESRLRQSHKMEGVGTLAGGIAHEFNNALAGIIGNIEILKMDFPADHNIEKCTGPMMESSRRMARLTEQLLAYAGGGKYQEKTISLNDFVENTLPILQHSLDSKIRMETDLASGDLNIKADITQMQTVLSATISNASEAIEGRGRIRISTHGVNVDKDFEESHPELETGLHVCIAIKDDGRGMDDETTSKIFEPFFTTKFQGRGLGMAAAHGIVRNHDGLITVDSELGTGTEVRIYLPAIEIELKEQKKPQADVFIGTGTILVIEDEEIVLDVTRALLERLGYRVLEAVTGKEAVDIVESFDGDIDLALLDIKLPDMDGGRIYPIIKKARPDLKVIICSGYGIDGPAQEILDKGAQDFIQKPYSLSTLSEKLKKVLAIGQR